MHPCRKPVLCFKETHTHRPSKGALALSKLQRPPWSRTQGVAHVWNFAHAGPAPAGRPGRAHDRRQLLSKHLPSMVFLCMNPKNQF